MIFGIAITISMLILAKLSNDTNYFIAAGLFYIAAMIRDGLDNVRVEKFTVDDKTK